MPCPYTALDGSRESLDLDSVVDVVRGKSLYRPDWQALVVYLPSSSRFIELRDSPPDVRGNSRDEAVEVSAEYLTQAFALTESQLNMLRTSPRTWKMIDFCAKRCTRDNVGKNRC